MDFNKIKAIGLEYAEKGKNAAMDLAEKGKTQALLVNEQGKLLKAQRQLGALVYSLAKGKEENQPLVDKYIEMIDTIEQEITRLKATLTPAEAAEVDYEAPMEEAEEAAPEQPAQPARKTCPQCGAPSRRTSSSARCAIPRFATYAPAAIARSMRTGRSAPTAELASSNASIAGPAASLGRHARRTRTPRPHDEACIENRPPCH